MKITYVLASGGRIRKVKSNDECIEFNDKNLEQILKIIIEYFANEKVTEIIHEEE